MKMIEDGVRSRRKGAGLRWQYHCVDAEVGRWKFWSDELDMDDAGRFVSHSDLARLPICSNYTAA